MATPDPILTLLPEPASIALQQRSKPSQLCQTGKCNDKENILLSVKCRPSISPLSVHCSSGTVHRNQDSRSSAHLGEAVPGHEVGTECRLRNGQCPRFARKWEIPRRTKDGAHESNPRGRLDSCQPVTAVTCTTTHSPSCAVIIRPYGNAGKCIQKCHLGSQRVPPESKYGWASWIVDGIRSTNNRTSPKVTQSVIP